MAVVVNRIIGGVHSDHHPNQQPENTFRNSRNGVITDVGDGYYIWETITGNKISFTLSYNVYCILGWCTVRERFILLVLDKNKNYVQLIEVTVTSDFDGTPEIIWTAPNSDMNLSFEHPIRAMFGFYESQKIQRIYVTDYNNKPWVLNIGYTDPLSKTVYADPKFLPFNPDIVGAFGIFTLDAIVNTGYLRAGSYFFAWRYVNEDYFSEWSYLTNPVLIGKGSPGITSDAYQTVQGEGPDVITNKAITFTLSNLDSDYASIQIAAFYSNDYNSSEPGLIFYDGDLAATSVTATLYGNENAGTVTIEELLESSLVINKIRDMTTIKNRNIIGNVELREELDVTGLNTAGKDNQIDCEMILSRREVVLDIMGYPYVTPPDTGTITAGYKGLTQSPKGAIVNSTTNTWMYCGIQYQGVTDGGATLETGAAGTITWVVGEIFSLDADETDGAVCTSGTCIPVIALKKYLKSNIVTPIWSDYEWSVKSLVGEYLDYKSPVVSNLIKSLPGGEKVRYGFVAFDKTGSPFYARWLNNKNSTLGYGDPVIPKRSSAFTGGEDLIVGYKEEDGPDRSADGTYFEQLNGISLGISISDLDLTDIIDDISGFMIVQAPIAHKYIGSGLINFTYNKSGAENELFCNFGYVAGGPSGAYDQYQYPGIYGLVCPEDIFELKDFIIQPGDKIENHQYLLPYLKDEIVSTGYGRFSMRQSALPNGVDNSFDVYQKFLDPLNTTQPGGSNSLIGKVFEILFSTKINVQDDDIPVHPINESLVYKAETNKHNEGSNLKGLCGKHNVLVLDIDESGNNPVGEYGTPNPRALIVKIRRNIDTSYGGTSDSVLSNTNYIAIGHFQEINDTVKADIESNGRYIFNSLEVFGGDHFIGLMDHQRVLVNRDASTADYQMGHGVIFPVESLINIALREGTHLSKDRPYQETINTTGISHEVANFKLEEFNYNDGYSSSDINDYYLPFPFNTILLNKFDAQLRHSPQKSIGEREDQFRIFNVNDKLDLDSINGEIINIKSKYNRIIYWQRDAIGYVPVNERALTQTAFGDPVQLGVGGIFERYDDMTSKLGNSHQFGLVESDAGFHWYDAKRKMYISLTESLKLSQESIAKGYNNWFEANIDPNIIDYDNSILPDGYGISGGYDPRLKTVFHHFINPSDGSHKTIGYDIRFQKFVGEFDMPGVVWMRYRNVLFTTKQNDGVIYSHGNGAVGSLYGVSVIPEIQVVVKSEGHEPVFFDNFELLGNDKFFEQIICQTSNQEVTEVISAISRNYKYRNRRWYGNYPRYQEVTATFTGQKERLVDGYMILTFTGISQLIKFMELKSSIRKAY